MLRGELEHVLHDLQEPVGCRRLRLPQLLEHSLERLRQPLHGLVCVGLEMGVVDVFIALERAFLEPFSAHDKAPVPSGVVVGLPCIADRLLAIPAAAGHDLSGQRAVHTDLVASLPGVGDPHVRELAEALKDNAGTVPSDPIKRRSAISGHPKLQLRAAEIPPVPLAAGIRLEITIHDGLQCLPAAGLRELERFALEAVAGLRGAGAAIGHSVVLPERDVGLGPTGALSPPASSHWRARTGSEMQSKMTTPVWPPLI